MSTRGSATFARPFARKKIFFFVVEFARSFFRVDPGHVDPHAGPRHSPRDLPRRRPEATTAAEVAIRDPRGHDAAWEGMRSRPVALESQANERPRDPARSPRAFQLSSRRSFPSRARRPAPPRPIASPSPPSESAPSPSMRSGLPLHPCGAGIGPGARVRLPLGRVASERPTEKKKNIEN